MFSYIVVEDGRIVTAWQTTWDSYTTDPTEPARQTIRVSDEEYDKMKGRLEEFHHQDNAFHEKNNTEKQAIKNAKQTWREKNTVEGLQKRIEELERGKAK
jgi:hypothetical protein